MYIGPNVTVPAPIATLSVGTSEPQSAAAVRAAGRAVATDAAARAAAAIAATSDTRVKLCLRLTTRFLLDLVKRQGLRGQRRLARQRALCESGRSEAPPPRRCGPLAHPLDQ